MCTCTECTGKQGEGDDHEYFGVLKKDHEVDFKRIVQY